MSAPALRVALDDVAKSDALPATTTAYETGSATLVTAHTEQRPTVLGLIATGRMRPDSGTVRVNGHPLATAADATRLRRRTALVDAPGVSEPDPTLSVAAVVAEELAFAGRPGGPRAVTAVLGGLGLAERAGTGFGTLEPGDRIRLLTELALLRPDIDALVLTSPERHGGDPAEWWGIAQLLAARDLAVLVIAGGAARTVL